MTWSKYGNKIKLKKKKPQSFYFKISSLSGFTILK